MTERDHARDLARMVDARDIALAERDAALLHLDNVIALIDPKEHASSTAQAVLREARGFAATFPKPKRRNGHNPAAKP